MTPWPELDHLISFHINENSALNLERLGYLSGKNPAVVRDATVGNLEDPGASL